MAQLGARLNGIQEAVGSNPTSSTIILLMRVVPREIALVPNRDGGFLFFLINV